MMQLIAKCLFIGIGAAAGVLGFAVVLMVGAYLIGSVIDLTDRTDKHD